jgi:hypothetical protein
MCIPQAGEDIKTVRAAAPIKMNSLLFNIGSLLIINLHPKSGALVAAGGVLSAERKQNKSFPQNGKDLK